MTEGPNIWEVGVDIPIELFVMDPVTNLGLTGLVASITLHIQRASDSQYWNGGSWVGAAISLSMTEVDPVNQKGRYIYTLPDTGNDQADRYVAHAIVDSPGFKGENYEVHISRTTAVRLYEAEPA